MKNQIIQTQEAPKAIGPYSQAIVTGGLVFVSGQLPIDPATNQMQQPDYAAQTTQSMQNILNIIKKHGLNAENIVKTTIFVRDLNKFSEVNEAYGKFFKDYAPSRACVEVSCLPKNALVEIEAVASIF